MANGDLVRFRQGSRADVVSTAKQAGQLLFATYEDEVMTTQGAESFVQGDIYFDLSDGPSGIRVNLANDVDKARTLFAGQTSTSDTAGQWTATIDGITKLYDGLTIVLRLNTSYNSTFNSLNVNGLGAKLVWYRKNSRLTSHIPNGAEILLVYRTAAGSYTIPSSSTRRDITANTTCTDGWILATSYADGNTVPSAYCSTAAATTAKTASCTGYAATANHYIHIIFSNTNTANVPTLNINSTGAKPIYLNGQPVSASNHDIVKGSYIAYYDGTAYYLRNDGILPGQIEKATSADVASTLANGANIVVGSIDSNDHLPNATNTYNLGSSSKIWKQLYVNDIIAGNEITTPTLAVATNATIGGDLTVSGTINATINGNATSATGFANAKMIALTGDVTGSGSGGNGNNGWSIATTIGTGKVTNDMLAGNITNAKLVNAEIGIAGNQVALGSGIAASTLLSSLGLSSAMHFIGKATVDITDGGTQNPTISGYDFTNNKKAGDVIIDKNDNYEYVWTAAGKWEKLGSDSSYKVVQTAYDSNSITTSDANSSLMVSDISQNAQGVITVTKKNVITPQSFIIKVNGSSAENAGYWSFDGSTVRTINFVPGTGISITGSNGQITIANTVENTHYTANMLLSASANSTTELGASATQANPYLSLIENNTVRKSIQFNSAGNTTISGNASSITISSTDEKVKQSVTTTDQWRKVLLHYTTNSSGGDVPAATINQVYAAKGVEIQPSTGTLRVNTLKAVTGFDYSGITASSVPSGSAEAARHIWFSDYTNKGTPVYDDDFKYNPTTNVLTVGSITGSAASAAIATTANKVANTMVISGNGGTTENSGKWTFDGSNNKTINIKAGTGISITNGTNEITITNTVTDTDTHHTATMYLANSATAKSNITAATQNPYLNLVENDTVRKSIRFEGGGYTDVKGSADASKIIITSTDQRVQQTNNTSTNGALRLLLSSATNDTEVFDKVYKNANLTYNPSTKELSTYDLKTTHTFTYSGIETGASAGDRPVWYSYLGVNGRPVINADQFKYNPGTNTLTVGTVNGNLNGNATTATTASKVDCSFTITGNGGTANNAGSWVFDGSEHKIINFKAGSGINITNATNEITISTASHNHDSVYKKIQTAVSSPSTDSTTALAFIDTISQNTQGVISVTKKNVQAASAAVSGVVSTSAQEFAGDKKFLGVNTTIGRNIIRQNVNAPGQGDTVLTALGYKTGYPIYTDPTFLSGTNSVSVYNNSGNGTVTITRDTYTNFNISSPGTNSNYVLKIQNTGSANPNCGGFYQSITARANAQFIQIFRALVPVGRNLQTASNNMGDTYQDQWLTSNAGTGKWEWYARRVICGQTGTMSNGGHVSLDGAVGSSSAPVIWYLASCNVYDLTQSNYDGLRVREADAVHDNGNGTLTKFQYSASGMSSTSWLGSWDGYTLKAITPANALKSAIGTSAIGNTSTPIHWDGSKFVANTVNSLVVKIPVPSGETETEGTHKWTYDTSNPKLIQIAAGAGISITKSTNGFTIASTGIGTDDKVKQTNTTSNSNYRVLLSYGANDNEETNQAYKSAQLLFNPYTKTVTAENFAGTATTALSAGAFSSNATVTLTGDTTGTSAGSTKSWSVPTVTKYISGLGRRTSAAAIALNPSVDTGFKMTWHISDSSSRTNDAANSPSFDAAIINLPWDWGGYNGQIALQNTVAGNTRMQIRSAAHIDNGSSANPRYTPNYGAWREVVTATKATQIGGPATPIYISNTGQATACGDSLDVSITGNAATATTVLWNGINNKPETATRWPKWNEITQQGANSIEEGTSDFTDNTEIFSSYASNNGFADSNAVGKVYRRDAIKMYNYIKTKAGTSGSGFNIAGSSASCTGNAASASKVNNSLVIKISDGGTETEGTNKWTFDGSTTKSITIAAGTGISLTGNANTGFTITNTARDSHYTTAMYLGASNSATTNNASNTTSPYLMVLDNSTVRNRVQFTGSGATTVTGTASSSNPTGTITIASTDENVQQLIDNSDNVNYRLLLTKEANTQNTVGATHFSTNLMFNPSTGLMSGQSLSLTGTLAVTQNATFSDSVSANGGLTASELSVTGDAAFSVTPTAPTAAAGTNDTTLATTAFVNAALQSGAMGNGSPLKVARYDGTGGVIEAATQHTVNNYQYVINDATAGGQGPAFKLVGKNQQISLLIGSGNDNRGLYNDKSDVWMLYWDANNYAILNSGKLGINGSNTSYNFYVNGSSFFKGNILNTGNTTHNGIVYFANGTTYYINNSAQGYLANLSVGTGTNTSYKLYVAGESYFNGNANAKNIYHWNANAVQDGSWVTGTTGTASATGTNILTLGNATATGTANNAKGYLRIYGGSTGYGEFTYNDTMFQSNKSLYLSNTANSGISNELRGIMAATDYWRIAGGATASDAGYLEIASSGDANEPIYVRQYSGTFGTLSRTLTLLDASGNTIVPGKIQRTFSASNQVPMLQMYSQDYDNYLWKIGSGTTTDQYYGYALKYIGTGSGAANYLQLLADNQNGTDVIAIGVDQSGRVGIGDNASTDYRLYVNGDSQFKGSLLPQATDTYDLGSAALRWKTMYVSQFNPDYTYKNSSTVTVKASEWTNIIAGNTTGLDDGTYIIQLKITSTSNTAYYSGICSWIKATSSAVNTYSEIPLHAVQKGLANQFYLRTAIDGSGIYLQISQTASANTSLAANAMTISFKKIM